MIRLDDISRRAARPATSPPSASRHAVVRAVTPIATQPTPRFAVLAGLLLALQLIAIGCHRSDSEAVPTGAATGQSATGESATHPTARESSAAGLLRQVVARYQMLASYRDEGQIVLRYRPLPDTVGDTAADNLREERTELAIHWGKPNRLSVVVQRDGNQMKAVADGQTLRVSIQDPSTLDLDGQVVNRPQDVDLKIADLYAATEILDPASPQRMISLLLALPLHLQATPLGLLLSDGSFGDSLLAAASPRELEPQTLQGVACRVLEVPTADGPMRLTIDARSLLLRRIDYPSGSVFQHLPADQRPRDVVLAWQARNLQTDNHVSFDATADVRADKKQLVQYFVLPPAAPASPRLGQAISQLRWTDVSSSGDGSVEDDASPRAGVPHVLVWFDGQQASREVLQQIERLRRTLPPSAPSPQFRAICVHDSQTLGDRQLQSLLRAWQVDLPVARDPIASGRDQLQIDRAPTTIVLDAEQRLQLFEIGANPQLGELIDWTLGQLAGGNDPAANVVAQYHSARERYDQQLRVARIPEHGETTAGETTSRAGTIAAATKFAKLSAQVVWENRELSNPGELLVIPRDVGRTGEHSGGMRLLALEEMRTVVELDDAGAVVSRRELPIPTGAYVARLRHARDERGRDFYLGFSQLGRFAYVFDDRFQLVLQYPSDAESHRGINDAQLFDVNRDGQLELWIAFAAPHACRRVELDGTVTWSSGEGDALLSLAEYARGGSAWLLATSERGTIQPIRADGQLAQSVQIGARTVHQLTATRSNDPRPTDFLGLSYSVEGRLIAVGLNADFGETWSYGLPGGLYPRQVEVAQSVRVGAGPVHTWLLAGPDGSVHLVQDDGRLHDRFNTGSAVHGLAAAPVSEGVRIYLASPDCVTAHEVQFGPAAAAR